MFYCKAEGNPIDVTVWCDGDIIHVLVASLRFPDDCPVRPKPPNTNDLKELLSYLKKDREYEESLVKNWYKKDIRLIFHMMGCIKNLYLKRKQVNTSKYLDELRNEGYRIPYIDFSKKK